MPELCVCGHEKVCHTEPESKCDCDYSLGLCECRDYRPVLDWPDSEGNYWVPDLDWPLVAYVVSTRGLVLRRSGQLWSCDEREIYERTYGPARFTKLVETNPFEK